MNTTQIDTVSSLNLFLDGHVKKRKSKVIKRKKGDFNL